MFQRTFLACLGWAIASHAIAAAAEREQNFWPVRVAQLDTEGKVQEWQGGGPLFFKGPLAEGRVGWGFRPFYMEKGTPEFPRSEIDVLYPFFTYRRDSEVYRWSIFELINREGPRAHSQPARPTDALYRGFDIWPFYFSRETGYPETSYHALFPIYGHVVNRLYNADATWVLAPLYIRTVNHGIIATSAPWPFIRVIQGNGNSGFALWPLFGWRGKPGVHHEQFYLWPLIYKDVTGLDQPQPAESLGFLPFYARDSSPDVTNVTYLWPFFGYTHRTAPYRYDETHYFWPFFVQGRGDEHYRNRWAPFYTRSVIKGTDKTWYLWPLFRQEKWTEAGLNQKRTTFLFVVYWSLRQSSATNPKLAPAVKTHLWPLFSRWDNGAGRRQFELFSPFEVLMPDSENVRALWTPLFALYRFDQPAPGNVRHSVLFDFITWRRATDDREFHLGPILSVKTTAAVSRVAIAGGLLGWQRTTAGSWRPFWFDFPAKAVKPAPSPR